MEATAMKIYTSYHMIHLLEDGGYNKGYYHLEC